ncbi:N-acetylmuramic acid 6-phosphate etherase [Paenibacillus agilis]|uniref:N-acetylmuramic acid 6-phosphate etherase n=1 Tax=Paenibacillus agilis TaxID=3020863 RepID=A0A559IY37_9BACL|nr:N-acetylmuramic acid 6-phosphate etherase [Paenibacillus agilis]TVX92536.1 N-acetylmuramic acid 6-phosphate etherase [Paenibacillus agilis]
MDSFIKELTTEQQNENTRDIDLKSTIEILTLINQEDRKVPDVIAAIIPIIAESADAIVASFQAGGRLFYFGAGTSGRLGILDASECPPTYGTDPEMVQGIIAGGNEAVYRAIEGAEDSKELGMRDVDSHHVHANDVVIGIAASGRTPYVLGAMERAKQLGATVIGISNNADTPMKPLAKYMIEAVVGPETVLGSTRMKSGTAQKLILNMLTTTSMIRIGKVYDNLMVDLNPSNYKLISRAKRLIQMATGAEDETVEHAYEQANGHVKLAIVMIVANVNATEASQLLEQAKGYVREAVKLWRAEDDKHSHSK